MSKWGRPAGLGERSDPQHTDQDQHAAPFVHPADAMEEPPDELEAHLRALDNGRDVADLFRRLFALCLPSRNYAARMGAGRHWQAGFHRMVAIAYTVTPEMFNGMKPQEVADTLGVSWWTFRKQLRAVRDMLDERKGAVGRGRRVP